MIFNEFIWILHSQTKRAAGSLGPDHAAVTRYIYTPVNHNISYLGADTVELFKILSPTVKNRIFTELRAHIATSMPGQTSKSC